MTDIPFGGPGRTYDVTHDVTHDAAAPAAPAAPVAPLEKMPAVKAPPTEATAQKQSEPTALEETP